MKSIKPGKQRKHLYNAPLHKKRKWVSSHLSENLLLKYDKRSVSVITGDEVEVMRGSFKGHKDKVASVHVKKQTVEVEGMTTAKADGTKIAKSIHASNLLITKLNLTDKWRRQKLERGLSETTKKEIEKEAKDQIKEFEEEKKIAEETLKAEEEIPEEIVEEESSKEKTEPVEKTSAKKVEKTVKSEEKTADEKEKKEDKPKQKKTETKPKTDKKPVSKKTESTKKKTVSKTPTKPKEKKEEGKA